MKFVPTEYQKQIMASDLLIAAFDLPTQALTFHCHAESPLHFLPEQEGATPGTTLAGSFGDALIQVGCARHRHGGSRCPGMFRQDFTCPEGPECPFPWLYKPFSPIHRRTLGRPVRLRAPRLEENAPVQEFDLEVALWSRHAVTARDVVAEAIRVMGENGLDHNGQPVRFRLLDRQTDPSTTLRGEIERLSGPAWRQALLLLETPLLMQSRHTTPEGTTTRSHGDAVSFNLATLVGNSAYELVAWDLEDRGSGIDQAGRHDLCRQARRLAQESVVSELSVVQSFLQPVDLGCRTSRSNQQRFPLKGLVGHLELAGNISAVLPWLVVLELLGGGQHRSMGFGAMRLWLR